MTVKDRVKEHAIPPDSKVLVTSALPYVNSVPHLGHIVGSHLPADVFARYCRTKGYETLFVGGTDEHGSASEIAAAKLNIPLDRFCSVLHDQHKRMYAWLDISYDNFSRTTNPIHTKTTKEFFKDLNAKGFISEKTIKVLYSPKEKMFLPDRYVVGTCPKCGYTEASGDQCERCASLFEATELIDPKSAITGSALEVRDSLNLFFKADELAPEIRSWIEGQTQWREQVSKLAMGWMNEGIRERCITRDIENGIKVPLPGFENKVFYVWFDAPIGYVSFTREARPDDWKDFWQSDRGRIFNFLGKDNIPFHTIFWPGMLIAKGDYNLPSNVVGLQYLNYEGRKFSKSKNWGVFCQNLPEAGIDSDTIRGALISLIPEVGDTEFKWGAFQQTINSDLLGNFGNLINRTVTFVYNKLDKTVSKPKKLSDLDKKLMLSLKERGERIGKLIEAAEIRGAFNEFLLLSSDGNRYFDESKPWVLVKEDVERTRNVLFVCVSFCKGLATISSPFLPKSAARTWKQLNLPGSADAPGSWDCAADLMEEKIHTIGKPSLLYQKLTDDDLEAFKNKVTRATDLESLFKK